MWRPLMWLMAVSIRLYSLASRPGHATPEGGSDEATRASVETRPVGHGGST
jgi:hypothetical protein